MFGLIVFLHVVICILLGVIILMQSGKGGGLTENFAAAESLFGATTNTVLVKATTVLACLFIVTSLSLAFLSSQGNKSLISERTVKDPKAASALDASAKAMPSSNAVQSDATETASNLIPESKPTEGNANPETNQQPAEPAPVEAPQPSGSAQ